ncbi:hypothetical protein, partial [Aliidongia dinghuensis]|uniref:hypothetical protein n=1 Tax=Aliidongia dinghuensis TaxID=1867774 RepID=UPI001E333A43
RRDATQPMRSAASPIEAAPDTATWTRENPQPRRTGRFRLPTRPPPSANASTYRDLAHARTTIGEFIETTYNRQ